MFYSYIDTHEKSHYYRKLLLQLSSVHVLYTHSHQRLNTEIQGTELAGLTSQPVV